MGFFLCICYNSSLRGAQNHIHTSHYKHSCAGTEGDLGDCDCTGDRAESCGHRGDVGIECNIPEECSGPTYNVR